MTASWTVKRGATGATSGTSPTFVIKHGGTPPSTPVSITSTSPLPSAATGTAYSYQFTATGGVTPYTWAGSALPSWATLSTGGLLTGTPTATGSTNFNVQVTGAAGSTASGSFSITVSTAATGFVAVAPFTVTGTATNGGVLTVTRSSGTFAAKTFGNSPWLFDTVAHQYMGGTDLNAYASTANGAIIPTTVWGWNALGYPDAEQMRYWTTPPTGGTPAPGHASFRTPFDTALYSSGVMTAPASPANSGKSCLGLPNWPAAFPTMNHRSMYLSYWGMSIGAINAGGGNWPTSYADGSNKTYRSAYGTVANWPGGVSGQYLGGVAWASEKGNYQSPWNQITSSFNVQRGSDTSSAGADAGVWRRHEWWFDNNAPGAMGTQGQIMNMWIGAMGQGQQFSRMTYSTLGGFYEACHPADIMYTTGNPRTDVYWSPDQYSTPYSGLTTACIGWDDGHQLSSGNIYSIAQIYIDVDFQRPEVSDSATWDVSPTSVMNREVQGKWSWVSATQISVTVSQGQFASLSGKSLWYLTGRNTAERIGYWT